MGDDDSVIGTSDLVNFETHIQEFIRAREWTSAIGTLETASMMNPSNSAALQDLISIYLDAGLGVTALALAKCSKASQENELKFAEIQHEAAWRQRFWESSVHSLAEINTEKCDQNRIIQAFPHLF